MWGPNPATLVLSASRSDQLSQPPPDVVLKATLQARGVEDRQEITAPSHEWRGPGAPLGDQGDRPATESPGPGVLCRLLRQGGPWVRAEWRAGLQQLSPLQQVWGGERRVPEQASCPSLCMTQASRGGGLWEVGEGKGEPVKAWGEGHKGTNSIGNLSESWGVVHSMATVVKAVLLFQSC